MNHRHLHVDETPPASEYEADFALWAEHQIALLRARRFDVLDVDNLIEEVDGMNRGNHRALQHRLFRVLRHLLKCACQPERTSHSWRATLHEQRCRIGSLLKMRPSLDRLVDGYIEGPLSKPCVRHPLKRACRAPGSRQAIPIRANRFSTPTSFPD